MSRRPLAVFSSQLGLPSESFVHRHMADLLPGETVAIVQRRAPGTIGSDPSFPCLVLEEAKRDWRWLYQSGLHFLGLSGLGPSQWLVRGFLRRHGVEVILSEYLNLSLRWLALARQLGIRFYAHAHGYDVSKTLRDPRMGERYLRLNEADGIITVTVASRARLIALGLEGSRIHVIPCGVDIADAGPPAVKRDTIRCIAVGRMVAKKSPLLTLRTFQQALAVTPGLTLDVVGDGELFDEAARFVSKNRLDGKITLHGSRPHAQVLELLKGADIFLQHSRTDPATGDEEGLPVSILEAMASGLPVVATRHAGIPEAVVEGETGILVNEGDVNAMAEAVVRLARDPDLRVHLGHAGRRRAKDRFTWARERADLIRLLGLRDTTSVQSRAAAP